MISDLVFISKFINKTQAWFLVNYQIPNKKCWRLISPSEKNTTESVGTVLLTFLVACQNGSADWQMHFEHTQQFSLANLINFAKHRAAQSQNTSRLLTRWACTTYCMWHRGGLLDALKAPRYYWWIF